MSFLTMASGSEGLGSPAQSSKSGDGSVNGIFPTSNFSGSNSVGPGATTPGTTGGNLIQAAATAGIYGV